MDSASEVKSLDSSDYDMWNDNEVSGNMGTSSGGINNKSDAATIDIEDPGTAGGNMHTFSNFPDSAVDADDDSTNLIPEKRHGMWSFAFYQQLFDVDTSTVTSRIKESVMPFPSRHTDSVYIGGKPDLYGPVWISATLVLIIGVCSNINFVFDNLWKSDKWRYTPQFEQLYVAGIIVYSYVFAVPLLLYTWTCWKNNNQTDLSATHLISSYGYSIASFIPLTLLLVIRIEAINWIAMIIMMGVTGSVLVMKLWPKFQSFHKTIAYALSAFIFLLHVAVTVLIKLSFFSHTAVITPTPSSATNTTVSSTTLLHTTTTIAPTQ